MNIIPECNTAPFKTILGITTLLLLPLILIAAPSPDLNSDGTVNVQDLGILLSNWGTPTNTNTDLNQDGTVNVQDLGILLSAWGSAPTAPPPPPPPPSPSLTCPAAASGAFTACYYDNSDFTNLKVSKTQSSINFDWGTGSPDPAIAADTFSATWEGKFSFDAATYTFTATADDGIRVYLDGTQIIDGWKDQPATTYTADKSMTAGTHTVRVEYYENGGGAEAKLAWVKKTTTTTPPPPSSGGIAPSPVAAANGAVLLEDGFETGDYRVWSAAAPLGDPNWSGIGAGGAVMGDAGIRTQTQGARVKSGQRAWLALVDPEAPERYGKPNKSQVHNWSEMKVGGVPVLDYYLSAWYFIPTDYPVVWSLLMQAKQNGSHEPMSIHLREDGTFGLVTNQVSGTTACNGGTGVTVPRGRIFNLTSRWVLGDPGRIQVWLDGTLIRDLTNCRTLLPSSDGAYTGVGNYIADNKYPFDRNLIPVKNSAGIWIDDIRVTRPK